MGASSSTQQQSSSQSPELQQEESLAASTASLPTLRAAFSKLSNPNSTIPLPSLQEVFSTSTASCSSESLPVPDQFSELIRRLGPCVVSLFFAPGDDGGFGWIDFLRGCNRCCARLPLSQSLNMLCKLYAAACREAGLTCGLEFDSDDGGDGCGKVGGSFRPSELLMFLWMCWIMMRGSTIARQSKGEEGGLILPDVTHLMSSAFVSCNVIGDDAGIWKCDLLGPEKTVPVQKLQTWVLTTASGLASSLSQYVRQKVRACAAASEENSEDIATVNDTATDMRDVYLLTRGRAWAISLALRSKLSEEFLGASFFGMSPENLLYRSSVHGKGLSRFWSHVEGYNGPSLILLSANSADANEGDATARRWVIGVLTEQGFQNRDTFFGSSGYLFAVHPIFRVLSPSGKEQNFIYCHLHPTIRVYEPNPKPFGLGFGGSIGNERIFLDEDFAGVTIRHHAVDKTYQHGSLIPNQGFLPVEASIVEVEVWGFGGERAKEQQNAYKKRETLFSEQRRKVDLKTFASWEDSPEKMMMDMVSDPNSVRREDR